jgi:hypothetical protein
MKPVRIKYYGLIWMTKRAYLLTTLILGLMVLAFFGGIAVADASRLPPFHWPWDPVPANAAPGFEGWFVHHFWTIIFVFCLAELVDILVTLHKFAQKEAEQATEDEPL